MFEFSKGYMTWGTLFSVQPPFFPTEAEKKGSTPSEVQQFLNLIFLIEVFMLQFGFVFGIAHLAAMIFAPFFAATSPKIGAKNVFVVGSLLQSLFGGLLFAFLVRFLLFCFP